LRRREKLPSIRRDPDKPLNIRLKAREWEIVRHTSMALNKTMSEIFREAFFDYYWPEKMGIRQENESK